jgi:hypothetical protein
MLPSATPEPTKAISLITHASPTFQSAQATSAGMADFVNRVIRSGFALGKRSPPDEAEKHDLFTTNSRSSLGDQMFDRDAFCLSHDIEDFKRDLHFLSRAASTVKNSFVIMKSSMQSRDFRFLLYDSITVTSSLMLNMI